MHSALSAETSRAQAERAVVAVAVGGDARPASARPGRRARSPSRPARRSPSGRASSGPTGADAGQRREQRELLIQSGSTTSTASERKSRQLARGRRCAEVVRRARWIGPARPLHPPHPGRAGRVRPAAPRRSPRAGAIGGLEQRAQAALQPRPPRPGDHHRRWSPRPGGDRRRTRARWGIDGCGRARAATPRGSRWALTASRLQLGDALLLVGAGGDAAGDRPPVVEDLRECGGCGRCARRRRSMNSKSWIVSKAESKPPTSSASERRTTSRCPMYIAPSA